MQVMARRFLFFFLASCTSPPTKLSPVRHVALWPQDERVVLITVDGVRWQDFFNVHGASLARDLFPCFWRTMAPRGLVVRGDTIASVPLSLPGYQGLMTGRQQACDSNDCDAVAEETVLEYVQRALGRPVAAFASWTGLQRAVGNVPLDTTRAGPPPPWPDARWDEETWTRAMASLRAHRPRLLYIGLLDSDEWAHRGDRDRYVATLHQYDRYLCELDETLSQLGLQARTTVIVTTDHGRGPGANWHSHGAYPEAREVFFAFIGPRFRALPAMRATHARIRPTIEWILGLYPTGEPIQ
jgi:hypothetical protein